MEQAKCVHVDKTLIGDSVSEGLHHLLEVKQIPGKGVGVFTTAFVPKGSVVVVSRPVSCVPERTHFSVQVTWDSHIDINEPGVRINHSCDPTVGVKPNTHGAYDFIARKDLSPATEITFSYPTTEYESIALEGVTCLCGSEHCLGNVTGWEALPEDMKQTFLNEGIVAPFIAEKEGRII